MHYTISIRQSKADKNIEHEKNSFTAADGSLRRFAKACFKLSDPMQEVKVPDLVKDIAITKDCMKSCINIACAHTPHPEDNKDDMNVWQCTSDTIMNNRCYLACSDFSW